MNFKFLSLLIVLTAIIICPADAGQSEQITINASGDGAYHLGEEITFYGTNTGSDYTYLFITGPNVGNGDDGAKLDDPTTAAISDDTNTFTRAAVTDNTWEYRLETSALGLEAGTYAVYAVTEPKNAADLSGDNYDTVSIMIKKPYIQVKISETDIKAGEEMTITGSAVGNPRSIGLWILGPGSRNDAGTGSMVMVVPEDDGSYRYVLEEEETAKMDGGEYFVIVQHSMYNDRFDTITEGVDSAETLIMAINSPDVDDTYALCRFQVEGLEKGEQSENNSGGSIFGAFGDFITGILG